MHMEENHLHAACMVVDAQTVCIGHTSISGTRETIGSIGFKR